MMQSACLKYRIVGQCLKVLWWSKTIHFLVRTTHIESKNIVLVFHFLSLSKVFYQTNRSVVIVNIIGIKMYTFTIRFGRLSFRIFDRCCSEYKKKIMVRVKFRVFATLHDLDVHRLSYYPWMVFMAKKVIFIFYVFEYGTIGGRQWKLSFILMFGRISSPFFINLNTVGRKKDIGLLMIIWTLIFYFLSYIKLHLVKREIFYDD